MKAEGYMMFTGNFVGAIVYYLLSKKIIIFGHMSFFPCLICMLLFFGLTELLPTFGFVYMQNKLVQIERGEIPEAEVQVAD